MMELLSPAGGMEQLRAALHFGADAVYGGVKRFGLRANAGNFDWDQLKEALSLVHGAGKRFYLTLNILPYDDEMEELVNLPEWVRANFRWVRDTFGKDKMIRADLNRDESTTHLHCFVIMTDEQGRFNSSRFFNKKKQVIEMQDSYAASMKRFGLVRGLSKEQTGAQHQTLNEWHKAECERLEQELAQLADNILAEDKETQSAKFPEHELFDELR